MMGIREQLGRPSGVSCGEESYRRGKMGNFYTNVIMKRSANGEVSV
jgi:hypothetical protein